MRDHRHRTILFWELAIATCLLTAVYPSLAVCIFSSFAFIPFGVFGPVISSVTCAVCNAGTQNLGTVSVTIAGVTNNTNCSDCANLNRTWSVFWLGSSTPCVYKSAVGPVVACAVSTNFVQVSFQSVTGIVRVNLHIQPGAGTSYDSANRGDPQDCSDNTGLSGLAALTAGDTFCTYTGSTATVVF